MNKGPGGIPALGDSVEVWGDSGAGGIGQGLGGFEQGGTPPNPNPHAPEDFGRHVQRRPAERFGHGVVLKLAHKSEVRNLHKTSGDDRVYSLVWTQTRGEKGTAPVSPRSAPGQPPVSPRSALGQPPVSPWLAGVWHWIAHLELQGAVGAFVEEEVARFEVAVDEVVRADLAEALRELPEEPAGLLRGWIRGMGTQGVGLG